jgi:lipopolysaccharide export system protein LptA
MTADQNSKIVTFSGRVIARQDDLLITCDRMRVHYQPVGAPSAPGSGDAEAIAAMEAGIPPPPPQGEGRAVSVEAPAASPSPGGPAQAPQASAPGDPLGGGQEVHRVDCEGSVRVQQGDKLAVGQKALYLAKSEPRRLILTGEARLWEGANSVTGHQVVYYLDQNRSQVTSRGNRRVRAFYDQGDGSRGERRK